MTTPLQLRMGVEAPHRNRYLFSDHYLENILPDDPRWQQAFPEAETFCDWLREHYASEKDQLPDYNESQLEQYWFRPIFERLGHVFELQASVPGVEAHAKRPDYVFFPDEDSRKRAASLQNEEEYAEEALAVGEVKRWDTPLSKKRPGGSPSFEDQNPSFQIDYYVRITAEAGLDWGILTNGRLWRLVHKDSSQRLNIYYEVDLVDLLSRDDPGLMRYFTLFFRQAAFQPDTQGRTFLDDVLVGSNAYAVALEEDVQENVYQALEWLVQGFLELPENEVGPDDLQEVYDNSLYLLYRLLFILYGESRGLLPMDSEDYREHYSLESIKRAIVEGNVPPSPMTTVVWRQVHTLFRIISGDKAELNRSLGVPRYDGGLFNPKQHPFLEEKEVGDQALVAAIDLLSRRETAEGREFVDYRTLEVRHLGSIYEGLLEYQPRVAEEPKVAVGDEWLAASEAPDEAHVVDRREAGEIYLETDRGERKATGSYYTPQYIVEYIVGQTLGPLVKQISESANGQELVDAILDLKCLDPAMGSGHFLVEATEYLARALATDPHVEMEQVAEEDLTYWKRRVVERCIYGVDKNPLAVELAKLSLWLATVSAERPLSFLDHHLKCGDSLIGARVEDLGWAPPPALSKKAREQVEQQKAGQMNMFGHLLSQKLPTVMGRILEITEQESKDYDTVRAKEAADRAVRELKAPFEAVADLWVSAYFGNQFINGEYDEALGVIGQPDTLLGLEAVERARAMADERGFFHWELAFPEVFYDEQGQRLGEKVGFDAVIGNPPYGMTDDPLVKEFVSQHYDSSEGRDDKYKLFMERAHLLTRKAGYFSYITSSAFLTNLLDAKLRRLLLSTARWDRLVTFGYPVFADPTVHTAIFVIQNQKPAQTDRLLVLPGIERFDRLEDAGREVNQTRFLTDESSLITVIKDARAAETRDKIEGAGEPLGEFAHIRQCIKTGDNSNHLRTEDQPPGDPWKPVLSGGDVTRYGVSWPKRYLEYGPWLARNWQNPDFFERPKIIVRETSERITATLDSREFYLLSTLYSIYYKRESPDNESLHYLLTLLNSQLSQFYMYHLVFGLSSGAFIKARVNHYARLPIRRIDFTTPDDEREALVSEAKDKAEQAIQAMAASGLVGSEAPMDRAILAQATAPVLSFVEERLGQDPEQADVIHDLLAHLAERMIAMHEQKQERIEAFWLDLEGITDGDTFEALSEHGKWEASLWEAKACRPFVDKESRSTRHLDESLGWNEDCFKVFVKELAGRVSNLSDVVGVYRRHHPDFRALVQRIAATDRLIDLIVYQLYGLTEEEIAVVEGSEQ